MTKTIIITSGGTAEPIDKVRKITNMSTGRLGAIIAERFLNNYNGGFKVHVIYVHSKGSILPNHTWSGSELTYVQASSTQEVYDALQNLLTTQKIDAVIHSMAVSDYTVDYLTSTSLVGDAVCSRVMVPSDVMELLDSLPDEYRIDNSAKVSSNEGGLLIKLKKTPKIISKIKEWSPDTMLVGFKLLNGVSKDELISVARELLLKNQCEYVVANDLTSIREGKHIAYVVTANDVIAELDTKEKIAGSLVSLISKS